tara:strand:+ start:13051 stop:13614 length:564 start_codon:yes stop_codon:yes gene_type:complete
MKKIKVEIVGESPLLMNSPKGMLEPQSLVKTKTKKVEYGKDAESVAYRTKQGYLYVPNTAIKGCMINASSYKKVGRNALRPLIAGGLRVPEEELVIKDKRGKPIKLYEIDLRTVVVQGKNRIIKARPRIESWKLEFGLTYNENLIADPEIIHEVLVEAGERIGILDFRPQKTGEFGTFKVTKFKPVK